MSKIVEVVANCSKTFAVEINDEETEDDARIYALEYLSGFGVVEIFSSNVAKTPDEADQIKRHADEHLY